MKKILLLFMFCGNGLLAQQLFWNGYAENEDFFDEKNWVDTSTNSTPPEGSINPDSAIGADLIIENYSTTIEANGIINLGTSALSVTNAMLNANALSTGQVCLYSEAYVSISESNALQNNVEINFTSPVAWLRLLQVTPEVVLDNHVPQFSIDEETAVYQTNLRVDNYYENGSVVRSSKDIDGPLLLYSSANLEGNSAELNVDLIYSEGQIPNNLNNNTTSFLLKKGYMATFADNEDGTGKSKNYIAVEEDLIVDELPAFLNNKISFVRVLPWNWVSKKGRGGGGTSTLVNNTWFYHWNNTMNSTLTLEYVPMSWGVNGANSDAAIQNYLTKDKSTHVLAFNESDNCNDQSGQFGDLCQVPVAVGLYENLMKTGLRLVSPSGRENAPFGWLKEFHDKATEQDIRIDVMGVHWYDWGSNPSNSPNANANQIFLRFQNYLQNVYDLYGLPIWITEFNANPNRTNAVNHAFMQLALPYLESLDYVERYAWFEPNSDVADYEDTNGNLTKVGNTYKNHISTPSIPEFALKDDSNLDIYFNLIDPTGENLIFNGFYETGNLMGWSGTNIDILTNQSIVFDGTTSARIKAKPGDLHQIIDVKPNTEYDLSFYTRWFVKPNNAFDVQILNTDDDSLIDSQTMTNKTNWNLVEMEFTTPNNVNQIKLLFEKGNNPGWFIDNAVMFEGETLSTFQPDKQDNIKIYPNPTSDLFTISSLQNIQKIEIHNLYGQLVKQIKNLNDVKINVDIQDLSKGLYLVKTTGKFGRINTQKIIKN